MSARHSGAQLQSQRWEDHEFKTSLGYIHALAGKYELQTLVHKVTMSMVYLILKEVVIQWETLGLGIFLSLPPQHWHYRCSTALPAGVQTQVLLTSILPNELSSQLHIFCDLIND